MNKHPCWQGKEIQIVNNKSLHYRQKIYRVSMHKRNEIHPHNAHCHNSLGSLRAIWGCPKGFYWIAHSTFYSYIVKKNIKDNYVILFVKLRNLTLNKLEWWLAYYNWGLATLLTSHTVKVIKKQKHYNDSMQMPYA